MITLITGAPGSGKTAYAVNEVLKLLKQGDRIVITHGITDLKLPTRRAYCKSETCESCRKSQLPDDADYIDKWHLWVPDNAILLLDEVQEIWPNYNERKEPVDSIKGFEKHRHRGLDFILLTQHPTFISNHVQRLCSVHKHLTASWARRYVMEYPKVTVSLTESATAGVKSTYVLPKRVFGLYKSATTHYSVSRKIPAAVYVLCLALLVVVYTGFKVSRVFQPAIDYAAGEKSSVSSGSVAAGSSFVNSVSAASESQKALDFTPRYPGFLESAPAYDSLRKVSDFPRITACVQSKAKAKCTCYTGQATVYPTTLERCQSWIKNPDFNPYRQVPSVSPAQTNTLPPSSANIDNSANTDQNSL